MIFFRGQSFKKEFREIYAPLARFLMKKNMPKMTFSDFLGLFSTPPLKIAICFRL